MTTHDYLGSIDYLIHRALTTPKLPVHPATESTAIFVPVMRRPQNAAKFMKSLESSGFGHSSPAPLVKVYAIVDADDHETREAWAETLAEILTFDNTGWNRGGTWAEKINLAYAQTDEPWMLLTGDDVDFKPKWLDYAQDASRDGAHVIGTNDLQSRASILGVTTPHPLVRREYVKERGASWDGPGFVCHGGYMHICADSEIVHLAKLRRVWAFARHSEIEHLNPHYGLAADDETYRIGKRYYDQDFQLWQSRIGKYQLDEEKSIARAGV